MEIIEPFSSNAKVTHTHTYSLSVVFRIQFRIQTPCWKWCSSVSETDANWQTFSASPVSTTRESCQHSTPSPLRHYVLLSSSSSSFHFPPSERVSQPVSPVSAAHSARQPSSFLNVLSYFWLTMVLVSCQRSDEGDPSSCQRYCNNNNNNN